MEGTLEEIFWEEGTFTNMRDEKVKAQPISKPFIIVLSGGIESGRYSDEEIYQAISREILWLHHNEKGNYSEVNAFLIGQKEHFSHAEFYAIQPYKI